MLLSVRPVDLQPLCGGQSKGHQERLAKSPACSPLLQCTGTSDSPLLSTKHFSLIARDSLGSAFQVFNPCQQRSGLPQRSGEKGRKVPDLSKEMWPRMERNERNNLRSSLMSLGCSETCTETTGDEVL